MTDVFQSLLMFAAIFSVISRIPANYTYFRIMISTILLAVCSCIDANGITPILETAWDRGRIEFLNISPDPTVRHTLWTQVITVIMRMMMIVYVLITQMFGGCFVYCSLYAVNQAQVQRLLSLPSLKAGQAALWLQVNPSESI